jgi:beta-galactosidase
MTGLYLDWRTFVTYQTTDFMKMEIEALREGGSDIPVTTNMMWTPQQINYHYLKDYLDVISWDAYPTWHEPDQIRCAVDAAFNHSYFRSLKHKPFLLMESTPSNTNWQAISTLKRPGMHRLASLQAVAHGSDSVQYFQWRKGRGGSEKFHGAVIDHNGKASGRVFEDVKQVGISLEKLDEICGTKTDAKVAIIYDHKNSWALSNASGFVNADKQYVKTCLQHYKSFWKRGVDVEVIETGEDLSHYSLVVIPMLYSMDQAQIDRIERYVAQGGTAVATYATGYVNETDLCYLGGFPGNQLKDVFGLTADEIDTLYPTDKNTALWDGETYDVVDYCELITPTTAEALGFYGEDFYKGMPALLKNSYKAGKAYYIGCRDTGALTDKLYAMLLQELNIKTYDLPEGVTVSSREKYLFVQNFNDYAVTVNLTGTYRNLESGEIYTGTIELNPLDIAVVCPEEQA